MVDLELVGRHALLFDDDAMAAFVNSTDALVEWHSLQIDRYDVRHLLSSPPPPRKRRNLSSPSASSDETELDQERYLDLPPPAEQSDQLQEEGPNPDAAGSYTAVGFSYGSTDYQTDEKSDVGQGDSSFRPPFPVPDILLQSLPQTEKLHQIIARTAMFVSKHGGQSEIVLRVKQGDNPTFGFLMPDHNLHAYFRFLVDHQELLQSEADGKPETAKKDPNNANQTDSAGAGALSLLGSVYGNADDEDGPESKETVSEKAQGPSSPTVTRDSIDSEVHGKGNTKDDYVAKHPSPPKQKTQLLKRTSSAPLFKAGTSRAKKGDGVSHLSADADKSKPSLPSETAKVENLVIEPPSDLKSLVERLVEFIMRNGKQFEEVLIEQDRTHGRFPFLLPSNIYHPYYLKVLQEAQQNQVAIGFLNYIKWYQSMCSRRGTMAACRRECDGRGDQGHKEEMAEMHRKIEELSQVVQALLRRGRARANREVPKGNSEPFDIPEGSQEDECDEECKENLFRDACYANMDSVAVEDSSVDWETPPIYDEYEEDDGELVLEDLEEISISGILSLPNDIKKECSQILFDEYSGQEIHLLSEVGSCTCKSNESFIEHSPKPSTLYVDPFLFGSQMDYLSAKGMHCLPYSTILLTFENYQEYVKKKKKTRVKEIEDTRCMLMYASFRKQLNLEGKKIICHCKIRGRIFSNKSLHSKKDDSVVVKKRDKKSAALKEKEESGSCDMPFDSDKKEKFKMVLGKNKKDGNDPNSSASQAHSGVTVDAAAAAAILQAATRGIRNPNFGKLLNGDGGKSEQKGEEAIIPVPSANEEDSSEAHLTKEQKLKADRLKRAKMFVAMLKSGSTTTESSFRSLSVEPQEHEKREGSVTRSDVSTISQRDKEDEFQERKLRRRSYRSRFGKEEEEASEEERHHHMHTKKKHRSSHKEREDEEDSDDHHRKKHRSSREEDDEDRDRHRKKHRSSREDDEEDSDHHRKKHRSSREEDDEDRDRHRHARKKHRSRRSSSEEERDGRRSHKRHHSTRKHRSRHGRKHDKSSDEEERRYESDSTRHRKKSRAAAEELEEGEISGKTSMEGESRASVVVSREVSVEGRARSLPSGTTEVSNDLRAKVRAMLMATR